MPPSRTTPSAQTRRCDRSNLEKPRVHPDLRKEALIRSRLTHMTAVLQDSLLLARRLVFSKIGKLSSAQILSEHWQCIGLVSTCTLPPAESQLLLNKAIAAVTAFEDLSTSIVMDREIKKCVQSCDTSDRSSVIKLPLGISLNAAEAQYKYEADDASPEDNYQRQRWVFYLSIIIAQAMQRALRARDRGIPSDVMDLLARFDTARVKSKPSSSKQARDQTAAISLPFLPLQIDDMFEESIFGGRLARLDLPYLEREPDSFPTITGLVVMLKQNNIRGHWSIRDEVICSIVEGADEWERYLPLKMEEHSLAGFIPGDHRHTRYR